jgi:hypothetical protein
MPKSSYPERVPAAPEPSSPDAPAGIAAAQALARRYLIDNVRVLAGIAHSPDSEAKLQTRVTCIKEIDAIAGVIPQAVPTPPPPHDGDDGGGDLAS